jgi:predicted small secreted protein
MRIFALPPLLLCAFVLAGCGSSSGAAVDLDTGSTSIASGSSRLTLGVNSFLWRATLDTMSFMPFASEDPFGGVVITDWYSAPGAPNERMKVNIYILDRKLRADGLKVVVFRQTRGPNGWEDASVNQQVAIKLENAILTRARELRLATRPPGT